LGVDGTGFLQASWLSQSHQPTSDVEAAVKEAQKEAD